LKNDRDKTVCSQLNVKISDLKLRRAFKDKVEFEIRKLSE
jgi:hypothetical protein